MRDSVTRRLEYSVSSAAAVFLVLGVAPSTVSATQRHGAPEGLYVHQMAHVVFFGAMVYLVYRIRQSGNLGDPAWSKIAVGAVFFAVWNVDTFVTHFALTQIPESAFVGSAVNWSESLRLSDTALVYYVGGFDHLLCVPGILFFYLGLREFNKGEDTDDRGIQKEAET